MVAVGSTCTHGTVFSSSTVVRVAYPQPPEGPSRKSTGYLRRRFGPFAHRHHRPSVGLRRRIARSHPLQGRGPDANLAVLVREDAPHGPQSPVRLEVGGRDRRSAGARATCGPRHGGKKTARLAAG